MKQELTINNIDTPGSMKKEFNTTKSNFCNYSIANKVNILSYLKMLFFCFHFFDIYIN